MATPLGHGLAGVALGLALAGPRPVVSRRVDPWLWAAVAQAPDLDFLPGILVGRPEFYHHGASHSVGAALIFAVLAYAVGRWRGLAAGRLAAVGGAVYLLQVLIDLITIDYSPPQGVPLWWPLSREYLYPAWQLFWDVRRTPFGWGILWHDILAAGREALILGPPAILAWWWRRQPSPAPPPPA